MEQFSVPHLTCLSHYLCAAALTVLPNSVNINYINTADNNDEAISAVSTTVMEAVTNKQEQTPDNLAIVAAVFMRSAAVINDQTSIERTVSSCCHIKFCLHAYVYMRC